MRIIYAREMALLQISFECSR